jgi:hypothetical protein
MYLIYSGVCIKPTLPLYVATYNLRVPFASLIKTLNCRTVKFEAPNFIRIRAHTRWGQLWTTPLEAWGPPKTFNDLKNEFLVPHVYKLAYHTLLLTPKRRSRGE